MKIIIQPNGQRPTTKAVAFAYHQNDKPDQAAGWKKMPGSRRVVSAYFKNQFGGSYGKDKLIMTGRGEETILLIGKGPKKQWNYRRLILTIRRLIQLAKQNNVAELTLWLEDFIVPDHDSQWLAETITDQSLFANYEFNAYKKKPKEGWPVISRLNVIIDNTPVAKIRGAVRAGIIIGEEANEARTLANTPGGDMTPKLLADNAQTIARQYKMKIEVLGPKQIEAVGMGGIMGVARGSDEEPRFIIMEYNGSLDKKAQPIVLVGKGVTFDTGGLNVKPEDSMKDMHLDMAGAGAVIRAMAALARLKVPQRVIALVPAVENMPSGSGYRPGDLLKSLSGKTIEVLNTDAEGRIIMADALTYAERYQPQLVIDLATLTGSAMAALGSWAAALFTGEEKWSDAFKKSGEMTGDYVWPLPLWEEYEWEVKGTFGDIANLGKFKGKGGAINAAMFLKQFTGKYPWVHLDTAPTMTSAEGQHLAKGATGSGLRVVVDVLRHLSR
ncbi:MAG: leucyl aminopeptidase [Patescibacteria group bacterium]